MPAGHGLTLTAPRPSSDRRQRGPHVTQTVPDDNRKEDSVPTMKKRTRMHVLLALLIATAVSVTGCAQKEAPQASRVDAARETSTAASPAARDKQAPSQTPRPASPQRKIVVTHSLSVEVRDFGKSYDAVSRMAEQSGGYNTEAGRYRAEDGSHRGRVAMRVPPQRVGDLLDAIRGLGTVVSEETRGEDITEQYYDLETRLRNAKAAERRLLELLGKKTGKLADVLEVERELTRVRSEVESMEARKRNMELLTGMTTIVVELFEPHRAVPAARRVWEPVRTAFGDALAILALSLRYAILFVIGSGPWLGILAAAFFLRRHLKKRKAIVDEAKGGGE